jgi:trimethylamine--corrinoid protein Co-methyltransferase
MEKVITDIEALQTFAELFQPVEGSAAEIAFEAIADVQPGGHFFATQHTMDRYRTAFYNPLVADLSNFGSWTESGSKTATERANGIWKKKIEDLAPIDRRGEIVELLDSYIAKAKAEGGAEPES